MTYSEQSDRQREALEVEREMETSIEWTESGDHEAFYEMEFNGRTYTGNIGYEKTGLGNFQLRFSPRQKTPPDAESLLIEAFEKLEFEEYA